MKKRPTAVVHLEATVRKLLEQVEDAYAKGELAKASGAGRRDLPPNRPTPAVKEIHTFAFLFKNGRAFEVSVAELEPVVRRAKPN